MNARLLQRRPDIIMWNLMTFFLGESAYVFFPANTEQSLLRSKQSDTSSLIQTFLPLLILENINTTYQISLKISSWMLLRFLNSHHADNLILHTPWRPRLQATQLLPIGCLCWTQSFLASRLLLHPEKKR